MISEIITEIYDVTGKKVKKPITKKHKWLFPSSYPMGLYLSKPLAQKCNSLEEVRHFLSKCSYISDQEQFNREDYWMPPEEFEKRLQGDCDDFSIWAWRQLIEMGYETRFVVGRYGRNEEAHAWVSFLDKGKHFLLEPLLNYTQEIPQLSIISYKPRFSCAWNGERLSYFVHDDCLVKLSDFTLTKLSLKWAFFWSYFWASKMVLILLAIPKYIIMTVCEVFHNKRKNV